MSARLKSVLAEVEAIRRTETDPVALTRIQEELGATVRFNLGAHEIRLAGVAASCTYSRDVLVDRWIAAAKRKLAGTRDHRPGGA